MRPKGVHIARTYPSYPSTKRLRVFIQKHQNHTILLFINHPPSCKKSLGRQCGTTLSKYTHLGEDLVTEDNFSADTKGERFSRLFEGDGAFFASGSLSLRFFAEFSSLPDFLSSHLVSFSGDSFLDFFEADFSDDLGGLPLFLKKSGKSNPLNELS